MARNRHFLSGLFNDREQRGSRTGEVDETGRMLSDYQYDPEAACVTLAGRATIVDDVNLKRALWIADATKWYPRGPEDPNVVVVELRSERIEVWSASGTIMPVTKCARPAAV